MTIMTPPLLFGVSQAVYSTPFGASFAIMSAPLALLGAELIAVRDVYVEIDSSQSTRFKEAVQDYRSCLSSPSADALRNARAFLAGTVLEIPEEKWSEIIRKVEEAQWPTLSGFLSTRPLIRKPAIVVDPKMSAFVQWLSEQQNKMVSEATELFDQTLGLLAHEQREEAAKRFNQLANLCAEMIACLKGPHHSFFSKPTPTIVLNLEEYISWLSEFLKVAKLAMEFFRVYTRKLLELHIEIRLLEAGFYELLGHLWGIAHAYTEAAETELLFAKTYKINDDKWETPAPIHFERAGRFFFQSAKLFQNLGNNEKTFRNFKEGISAMSFAGLLFGFLGDGLAVSDAVAFEEMIWRYFLPLVGDEQQIQQALALVEKSFENADLVENNLPGDKEALKDSLRDFKVFLLLHKAQFLVELKQYPEAQRTLMTAIAETAGRFPYLASKGERRKMQSFFHFAIGLHQSLASLSYEQGDFLQALRFLLAAVFGTYNFLAAEENCSKEARHFADDEARQSFAKTISGETETVAKKVDKWEIMLEAIRQSCIRDLMPQPASTPPLHAFCQNFALIIFILRRQANFLHLLGVLEHAEKIQILIGELEWFEKIFKEINAVSDDRLRDFIDTTMKWEGGRILLLDKSGRELSSITL